MKLSNKKARYRIWVALLCFIGLCIFYYILPYSDDDLRWGSILGTMRLQKRFAGYGGRYLGYLIILAVTRSGILKILFPASVTMLLTYLVRYVSDYEHGDIFALLYLFLLPISAFEQTIGWFSGYANYVTSITFTLGYLSIVLYYLRKETIQSKLVLFLPLFLLGMCNTLIVEHLTIYNCILCIVVLLVLYRKHHKFFPEFFGYTIGCATGTLLMFSNSAYHSIANGTDNYRKINLSDLTATIITGLSGICRRGYYRFGFLHLCIIILLGIFTFAKRREMTTKMKSWSQILYWIYAPLTVSLFILEQLENHEIFRIEQVALNFLCCSSIAVLIILIVIYSGYHRSFCNCLFFLVSILVVDAPFFIARPSTPRVFFGSYIFLMLVALELIHVIPEKFQNIFKKEIIRWIMLVLFLFIFQSMTTEYYKINRQDQARLAYIREQVAQGATSVTVNRLPKQNYVHDIDPMTKFELIGYKYFYGLPGDLELIMEKKRKKYE